MITSSDTVNKWQSSVLLPQSVYCKLVIFTLYLVASICLQSWGRDAEGIDSETPKVSRGWSVGRGCPLTH